MRPLLIVTTFLLTTNAMAQVNCSRSQLQTAVNRYIAAQTAGDLELMDLVPETIFIYNMEPSTLDASIVLEALDIDFHRSLLDETSCQSFTEVIVTDSQHPYVIGTRMRLTSNHVSEFESIVTDGDDWLFNANNYLKRSAAENWGLIRVAARSSRGA